ncbi:MAG TPA: class E sortase [Acidimicrobiales bacterium]
MSPIVILGLVAAGCLGLASLIRVLARRAGAPSATTASHRSRAARHAREGMPTRPRGTAPLDRLTTALGSHRWARIGLGGMAVVLTVGAVGVLGYPMITDQYTHHLQKHLRHEFVASATRTAYVQHHVKVGDSLTRIEIPKMGLDTIVVEGTTLSALKAGAGHYVETPLPCQVGNVGIAGHRTTYGKPFNRLAELALGDQITLTTPVGSCTYKVTTAPFPVEPTDYHVVDPTKDAELTLTTCNPEGSARQRLVVHATLVSKTKGAGA